MPYYSTICHECGEELDIFRKVEQRDEPEYCCGRPRERVLTPAHVRGDLEPYRSPISGQWVNSRAQRNEELAREGCFINEPGVKQDIARRAEELKRKAVEPMLATIDQTVSALHAAGQI